MKTPIAEIVPGTEIYLAFYKEEENWIRTSLVPVAIGVSKEDAIKELLKKEINNGT